MALCLRRFSGPLDHPALAGGHPRFSPSVVKSRAFCQKDKRVCRRGGSSKLAAASQNPDTSRTKVRRNTPRQAREQEPRNGRKIVVVDNVCFSDCDVGVE